MSRQARASRASLLERRRWLPWRAGPAAEHDGPVVVSLTSFAVLRARELPGIYLAAVRLREGWYAMPGAIGMWLWGQPTGRRGGSLTVWQSRDDLLRFVSLPAHVEIMRRYRDRGTIWAQTWETDAFAATSVRNEAEARLDGRDARGGAPDDLAR